MIVDPWGKVLSGQDATLTAAVCAKLPTLADRRRS
jgi:hypothetical protein